MSGPYYQDDSVTLWHGDCIEVMRSLPDASVDAIVTDPPYGLGFMGREWDDLPPGLPWAIECLRVLKPGGHLLAFGGSRTWHRLASAVEDAGFEIRDSIAWLYGSGFPKSLDVAKAIDRSRTDADEIETVRAFLDRARVAHGVSLKEINQHFGFAVNGGGLASTWTTNRTSRATPTREQWADLQAWLGFGDEMDDLVRRLEATRTEGTEAWNARPPAEARSRPGMAHSWSNGVGWSGRAARGGSAIREDAAAWQGWGTALKPAFEPIVVARKPIAGTVAANVLAHGTGALNIDGCRIEAHDDQLAAKCASVQGAGVRENSVYGVDSRSREGSAPNDAGRWPTNVALDESQAAELDSESHGAARYFPTFHYEAKAPTSERPRVGEVAHPTVKPLDLMRWLVRLVAPPGGTVLEPFAGSGTTAEACVIEGFQCIAIEREADYLPLVVDRLTKPIEMAFDLGGLAS